MFFYSFPNDTPLLRPLFSLRVLLFLKQLAPNISTPECKIFMLSVGSLLVRSSLPPLHHSLQRLTSWAYMLHFIGGWASLRDRRHSSRCHLISVMTQKTCKQPYSSTLTSKLVVFCDARFSCATLSNNPGCRFPPPSLPPSPSSWSRSRLSKAPDPFSPHTINWCNGCTVSYPSMYAIIIGEGRSTILHFLLPRWLAS